MDYTKLRYALYVRKSTDDPKRQLRSIPDQISECLELADRLHITVVNRNQPVIEKKSAKIPNKRPEFNKLLLDIKNGKYDGILAWNPDRLARNMLEAGKLIDMADTGIIKDFKFVTHVYSADANGKMLLGMAFVLSKQYSDKLSQDVSRGVQNRFEVGLAPTPKHGYINEGGTYKPDGDNYRIMCEAWDMRSRGKSVKEIAKYMNEQGYERIVKKDGRAIQMDFRILSKIFHDPFYYGVLIQSGKEVDLRLAYGFQPATTEEVFLQIQDFAIRRPNRYKLQRYTYYPFRKMVNCSYCGQYMRVGASKSKSGQKYLYYRCDTPDCKRSTRSLRAKVILEFIYDFLEAKLRFTEADYNEYYSGTMAISEDKRNKLAADLHVKQGLVKRKKMQANERALKLVEYGETQEIVRKANEKRIEELGAECVQLEVEITKIKKLLDDPEKDKLSIEQFLNLSKNAAAIVKSADTVVKDQICQLIFLNFEVNEEKVTNYQLKEPFATLVKQRELLLSRGAEN